MFALFTFSLLVAGATAWTQLGAEYWTSVHGGQLGREVHSEHDLMTFPDAHGWIAYWIDTDSHHEVFGHAYRDHNGQICAYFATPDLTSVELCTGFRVMTKNQHNFNERNPFHWVPVSQAHEQTSVGYAAHYIAKIEGEDHHGVKMNFFYGDANLETEHTHGFFIGVDPEHAHTTTHVTDRANFLDHVYILQKY